MKLTQKDDLKQHYVFGKNSSVYKQIFGDNLQYLLILILLIDIFFIFANWLYSSNFLSDDSFDITKDLGYAEWFQYLKESAIALILLQIFRKTKVTIFIVWSLFFIYLLLDDSNKIHEIIGNAIASNLIIKGPHIFNLRGQDLGELIICTLVGSFFFLLFIRFFYQCRQLIKRINYNLIALVMLLMFCGIFVDMAHSVLPSVSGMTTLEDGGEMLVMSVICWYALNLIIHSPETVFSLLNKSSIKYANYFFEHFRYLFEKLHMAPISHLK